MKQTFLDRLINDIKELYPEHTMLEYVIDDQELARLISAPENSGKEKYVLKHFVEIAHEDLLEDLEEFFMNEIIETYVFYEFDKDKFEKDIKLIPVGVNPLTNGVIMKVDGFVKFL